MNALPTSDGWNTLDKICWPDYVGLSEEKRCARYAKALKPLYRRYYARRIDNRTAGSVEAIPGMRGKKSVKTLPPELRRALVKAVVAADVLGVPYPYYIRQAYSILMADPLRRDLPTLEELVEQRVGRLIAQRWAKKKRFADCLPHRETRARCPGRVRAYLQELVECNGRPSALIANLLEKEYVTEDEAMELFRPDRAQQGIGLWTRRRARRQRNPRKAVTTNYAVAVAQSAMEGAWTRSMFS